MRAGERVTQRAVRQVSMLVGIATLLAGAVRSGGAEAQSDNEMAGVAKTAKDRLQSALSELATLRESIADERVPLSKKVNRLESEVVSQRRELREFRRLQSDEGAELKSLNEKLDSKRQVNRDIERVLDEYVHAFETAIHVGEVSRYKEPIRKAKLSMENRDLATTTRLERQLGVVSASLKRLESTMGGERFQGEAMMPSGTIRSGQYAIFGPVGLFQAKGNKSVGWVELQQGSPAPSLVELPNRLSQQGARLIETGEGEMALDPTLGNAAKARAQAQQGVLKHLRKGGVVMVPLLLLAVCAASVSVLKWRQLSRVRVATERDLQAILDKTSRGDTDGALVEARRYRGPIGDMLETGVLNSEKSSELLQEMLYEKRVRARPRLERLLPFISVTAASAPLLGLLGTVTGMIETFNLITIFGTGDAQLLSSGISEALVTTEVGLMVAVPALLAHAFLSRRVRSILSTMDYLAVGFVNGLRE